MSRALVVGAAGFVGQHLSSALAQAQWEVVGGGRSGAPHGWSHEWVSCDLRSPEKVAKALAEAAADTIFQVAAPAPGDFEALLDVQVAGTARLLDAVHASGRAARVVTVGSAAEYGSVQAGELPVDETVPLRPVSLYGVTKVAQTLVALRPGVDAIVARLFNISGPGEPRSLVSGAFASQIAELERDGRGGPIAVGDLTPERDFVDVRDAAGALVALAERGVPGEMYNVCSGVPTSIGEVLELLTGQATVSVEPRFDPARAARTDVPRMVGSAAKLARATGWAPRISLERTLADVLGSYRELPAPE
jgi:GDP-4-dehydro-6-deoxy-D-mannose reductase